MNKMKKILACALALCMALALVACSGGNNTANNGGESNTPPANSGETNNTAEGGETTETEGNKLIAGIVFQEDQFFKLLSAGYQAAADDLGYEIQMTNTNNDQTRETDALNTYLAQGVAGVAISPLNTQPSPATIADVMDAGMKVAICNNALDAFPGAVASYSADNYSFCHQTGEAAVKFIQENYGADETINIGVIQFKTQIPEQSADRVDGFFAALDEAGINYEIIADQDAWLQDMAVETAGDMISANPDLDIIYAANDGGTVGSVMAVENAGKAGEIFVFGTDGSEQIVDLLKDDTNILQAVTAQDAFQIGYSTVEALVNAIEGTSFEGEGETNIIPGIPLVRGDTEGLDTYLADLQSMM